MSIIWIWQIISSYILLRLTNKTEKSNKCGEADKNKKVGYFSLSNFTWICLLFNSYPV